MIVWCTQILRRDVLRGTSHAEQRNMLSVHHFIHNNMRHERSESAREQTLALSLSPSLSLSISLSIYIYTKAVNNDKDNNNNNDDFT